MPRPGKFFVTGLLPECEDQDLQKYFNAFAQKSWVKQASVTREDRSTLSKCCGWVYVKDDSLLPKVLQADHCIWDQPLQVKAEEVPANSENRQEDAVAPNVNLPGLAPRTGTKAPVRIPAKFPAPAKSAGPPANTSGKAPAQEKATGLLVPKKLATWKSIGTPAAGGKGDAEAEDGAWAANDAQPEEGAWADDAQLGEEAWADDAQLMEGAWADDAQLGEGAWGDDAQFGEGAWADDAQFGEDESSQMDGKGTGKDKKDKLPYSAYAAGKGSSGKGKRTGKGTSGKSKSHWYAAGPGYGKW